MVVASLGHPVGVSRIRELVGGSDATVSAGQLAEAAHRLGFRARSVAVSPWELDQLRTPALLCWENRRWVVLCDLSRGHAYLADPALGKRRLRREDLAAYPGGTALEVEPRPAGADRARPSYPRQLLALLAARRKTVAGILGASLLLNLCGLAVPRITQAILDRVVPGADLALLNRFVLAMALVAAFQVGLTVWRRLTLVRLSLALDRVLVTELFTHLLSLPTQFFKLRRAGDLVARLNDGGSVRHLFAGALTRVAIDSLMVAVYFGVMFAYSTRLALLVCAFLLMFAGYTFLMSPVLKRGHRRLLEDKAAQEAQLVEVLGGIDLVKSLGIEEVVRQRWAGALARSLASNYRTQRLRQASESAGTAIKFLCTIGLLWYGAVLVVEGRLTTGQLVAFSLYAAEALVPLLSLITLWDEVQEARAALERMGEVLAEEPEPQLPTESRVHPGRLRGEVRFERVSFHYGGADAPPVLRGLSFAVAPGEHVAVVGRSGSGKTTLARLLLGLYRPVQGRVLIDGRDLGELDLAAYRRQVGVVPQENLLLTGTVRDNITLGDPRPDPGRVAEAARRAGASAFIAALAHGFDTVVGEMGLTLSGGQRQRLSLARALYRDPRLLILDEATGSLDTLGEREVRENLEAIWAGRTAFVIAHHIATVRHADRILVLQGGALVEQGTHEDLMAKRGAYYALAST
jgi:ATP-binding cassette subfamily B protein